MIEEKEVRNRDEEIKSTIQQREESGVALVKEREQWQAALIEKESRIKELEMNCQDESVWSFVRKFFQKGNKTGE